MSLSCGTLLVMTSTPDLAQQLPAGKHKIDAQLWPLAVPIANLAHMAGNPNIGDDEAVARSLRQFGQRKCIVAKRTGDDEEGRPVGIVIAGNTTLRAARDRLQWDSLAVLWTTDDEMTAKAYALADNHTADRGSEDEDALAEIIAELIAHGDNDLLAATAYDDAEIQKLLGNEDTTPPDTSPQLGEQTFSIIVECEDETRQAELLATFEREGLTCRPLMT